MSVDIAPIVSWVASILSAVVVTAATASINSRMRRHDQLADARHAETEAKRRAEAEWRESVDRILEEQGNALKSVADDRVEWYAWRASMVDGMDARLDEQGDKIMAILRVQCTQMRSDCVHRAHRYLDDLGCASTEEKNAFWAEYQEYCEMCERYGIKNNFVDELARRVMALPERDIPSTTGKEA